jgi:hypothetical protein
MYMRLYHAQAMDAFQWLNDLVKNSRLGGGRLRDLDLAYRKLLDIVREPDKENWNPDREMPMLDALLTLEKLWNSGAPALVQKNEMRKVRDKIYEEHDYMCKNEPQDQFHACVLLGALNLIDGLLSKKKVFK